MSMQKSGCRTAKPERQTAKTNWTQANDNTGNLSVKKFLELIEATIFIGCL